MRLADEPNREVCIQSHGGASDVLGFSGSADPQTLEIRELNNHRSTQADRNSSPASHPGQRQQLAIARALIIEPRLLILDEPTEGIQPSVVTEIEHTILELTGRGGISVLMVEQHIGFALGSAQRCYVLSPAA